MIADTSALMAILKREPEATAFNAALIRNRPAKLSAGTLIEARMHAERCGVAQDPETLIRRSGIAVVPIDQAQADAAHDGFLRFGKGRHPAALNLGDLFAYGLAKATGEPLLFKGNDFARTDLRAA